MIRGMKTSTKGSGPTKPQMITTTFQLPLTTWREIKVRAVDERVPLRTIVCRAIDAYLRTPLPKEVA